MIGTLLGKLGLGAATGAVEAVANVIDRFVETDDERRIAEQLIAKMAMESAFVQAEINKAESAHRSIFVAGWRPFIGWICGVGLSIPFVVNPLLQWITGEEGPQMPLDHIMPLVVALLGLGAYRTGEKFGGRAK